MYKIIYRKDLYLIVYFLLVALKIVSLNSKECNYIRNAKVYVNFAQFSPLVRVKETYEKTINGCIDNGKFLTGSTNRIGINCTGTEITMLEEHSVEGMAFLKSIDIYNCPIEKLAPRSFLNVPKLEWVLLSNGTINEIRRGTFDVVPSLKQVIVRGHEIEYVEDYAFGNMPTLKLIDLSYNKLRYLSTNWLTNSTMVNQLYLSSNFITRIREGTFQYVPNLEYLWLARNKIATIDAGAFQGLSKLEYLDLGQNLLTTISQDIFPKELRVSYVDLERNLLNYVSIDFLERLQRNEDGGIKIVGNPIKCQCLEEIHLWMQLRKLKTRLVFWSYSRTTNCPKSHILPVCGVASNASTDCTYSVDSEMTERYVGVLEKNLVVACTGEPR